MDIINTHTCIIIMLLEVKHFFEVLQLQISHIWRATSNCVIQVALYMYTLVYYSLDSSHVFSSGLESRLHVHLLHLGCDMGACMYIIMYHPYSIFRHLPYYQNNLLVKNLLQISQISRKFDPLRSNLLLCYGKDRVYLLQ